jgi:hypothetical protein
MRRLGTIVLIGWLATAAVGQTVTDQGLRPLDPLIEDVDPLRRSLRVVEPGLRSTGEQSSVFERVTPGREPFTRPRTQRIIFVSEGIIAEFDRSQYVVQPRTGRTFQTIPPNTVFYIGRPPSAAPMPDVPQAENAHTAARRVEGRLMPIPPAGAPGADASVTGRAGEPAPNGWDRYALLYAEQRVRVLRALERKAEGPAG